MWVRHLIGVMVLFVWLWFCALVTMFVEPQHPVAYKVSSVVVGVCLWHWNDRWMFKERHR